MQGRSVDHVAMAPANHPTWDNHGTGLGWSLLHGRGGLLDLPLVLTTAGDSSFVLHVAVPEYYFTTKAHWHH